ncbi:hypothetical protein [Flavobacterium muglaense]|uniref:Uncharacterized protein n=1 Tax=Flavobacterium muglaense TaxID=2764716 RepID=A0A923MZE8_9FLAO|nr:hypothetical protein [Flavobacterium muglaense]MBC5837409.1 hypothetical protein [Flavobacterium muglaense]MBC5843859.1 hypothetical protein [Flavobacterium muglaense]
MSDQDCKECLVAAIVLKKVSLLGLLVFITIPTVCIMVQDHAFNTLEEVVFVVFLLTGFLFGLRSGHLNFDSRLLKSLGDRTRSLSDVDQIVMRLFRKNIQGKTIQVRITSCYKLVKGAFVLLVLHLLCYGGLVILLLS